MPVRFWRPDLEICMPPVQRHQYSDTLSGQLYVRLACIHALLVVYRIVPLHAPLAGKLWYLPPPPRPPGLWIVKISDSRHIFICD